MPAAGERSLRSHPELYWTVRHRELARLLAGLKAAVNETQQAQHVLYSLSETAKLNEPHWEDAMTGAMKALRAARSHRTRTRKFVANARDTLRIRANLREACPPEMFETLDSATQLLEYLEAQGF